MQDKDATCTRTQPWLVVAIHFKIDIYTLVKNLFTTDVAYARYAVVWDINEPFILFVIFFFGITPTCFLDLCIYKMDDFPKIIRFEDMVLEPSKCFAARKDKQFLFYVPPFDDTVQTLRRMTCSFEPTTQTDGIHEMMMTLALSYNGPFSAKTKNSDCEFNVKCISGQKIASKFIW